MKRVLVLLPILLLAACSATSSAAPAGPTATPGPTAAPTQPSGTIWFGASVDTSAMTVTDPGTAFASTDLVGWVAMLSDSVNGTSLTLTLASVDASGAETTITTEPMAVANPGDNEFAHAPDDTLGSLGAGTYTLRYIRGSTVLASGTVTITP